MSRADPWYVVGDPNGDGWIVTQNGRSGKKFAPDADIEARATADARNGIQVSAKGLRESLERK